MRKPSLPLNALRAFEAAARHLSFTRAAAELNVTPAAVSHQVKGLEDLLSVVLFHRLTRALRLTEAGQSALPQLTKGFEMLSEATDVLQAQKKSSDLKISVSPSFGAMWLVPRLEKFRRQHPGIEVRIDGTDRLVDIRTGEADVAIRYGPGGYAGVQVDRLFGQLNTPVCSPVLLAREHPLGRPEDLRHQTLLHIDWKDAEASWRMWLRAAGLADIDATRGPRFTQESMAVQAALDGQGVALVGEALVADHLETGRLIRPFDPDLSTPLSFSYYLLSPKKGTRTQNVSAFRSWLLELVASAS